MIQPEPLRLYELHVGAYVPMEDTRLDEVGLGLTLWQGTYDRIQTQWLRWTDLAGNALTKRSHAQTKNEHAPSDSPPNCVLWVLTLTLNTSDQAFEPYGTT